MYNKVLLVTLILFGGTSFSMIFNAAHDQKNPRFKKGYVQLSLCKELYPFFAARICNFSNVEQTLYDSNKNVAYCYFKKVIDTEALENRKPFRQMLQTKLKPRRGHKNRIFFVLNSFVELQEILAQTSIFIFNKNKDKIILNPAFLAGRIDGPDVIEYFSSIEPDLHACANIALVPVLAYRLRN
jgi:hypothetical protein